MTFLAPGFLFAAFGMAAAVVALHFIVTRQPRAGVLPTARFVPDLPATAIARAARPSDLLLMLLRVLLVLAAGAGLARPVFKPSRGADARVILVDVSRAVTDAVGLRDSVRSVYRDGDALIVFDSASRTIAQSNSDSINSFVPASREGNLSAALIAAMRAGSAMRDVADSLELIVVSPFIAEEVDAATSSIRKLWPGRARLIRVVQPQSDAPASVAELSIRSTSGDPLAVAARLANVGAKATIVRDGSTPISAEGIGAVTVEWPVAMRPRGSVPRSRPDTIGGVLASDALVVAGFERRWIYPPDSLGQAKVIARWIDGPPAAIEWKSGEGCSRSVSVPVTPIGDLVIRVDFVAFVAAVSRPCDGLVSPMPMGPTEMTMLAGNGGLASRNAFRPSDDSHSWISPWLLGLALICAGAELLARRRKSMPVQTSASSDSRMDSAA